MIRNLLAFVLIATFATAAERPNLPANLTVNDALNLALNNSAVIRDAVAALDQASGRSTQARSELLPQVNAALRQNLQTVNLIGVGIPLPSLTGKIGPFGSMDARMFVEQQIFNLANRRSWQSSRQRVNSSRLLVDNARELVSLNVVAAYLDALRAKATRQTITEQMRLASELDSLTGERVRQGVAAELDAVRAMQQVNSLQQQLQEAEQSYTEAKLNLANMLQAQITSEFDVSDNAAYGTGVPPDRDAALKAAIAGRPDYRAAEASLRAAELNLQSAKSSRLPTLVATVDDGQSGNSPVHNANTYRVQGLINIPVFNGGRTRGEIEEAEGVLHEAQVAIDATHARIETDVLTALSGVEWALKEVETSAANIKLSRQELEFSRSRFDRGITDNTEVVNAQDRLSKADDAGIRAQHILGLARANLARAVGTAETTYHK